MPFARPPLTTLRSQAMQDVTTSDLPHADGFLRRSVMRVLALVQAGLAHLHYGFLDWIAKQAVPFTATDEYLVAWAGLKGIIRKAATQATGPVMFTGVAGSAIPSGAAVNRSDGLAYVTTTSATISGTGSATVTIQAVAAGAAGDADTGGQFILGTAIGGVNSVGFAVAPIAGGADQESDADFRTRMLQRYAQPPQGGALADYLEWAAQVPGVTRAWASDLGAGAGMVIVWFMMDEVQAAHQGFPQGTNGGATSEWRTAPATGDMLTVANWIYPLRPVTALVYVAAPTALPVNFSISNLSLDTADIRTAISAALTALFRQSAQVGGTMYQSQFEEAVTAVAGVSRFTLSTPLTPVVAGAGYLPVLGTISYV